MLELKNIKKDYITDNNAVHVLKGLNITFRQSEFVSILGQSGCGKTTLLNIMGGLDHFSDGDLIINGKSTKNYTSKDWDTYRNHSIGFVFQSYNLIPHQTILANVELALAISGVSKKERKQRAIDALIKVGLGEHIHKKPNQLSGGQCQRVSIARAIVNNPDIILADEPTGALDSDTSVQVMDLLKQIASDRLVIMVTHNPELAEKYSTRIVKMLDGVIQSDSNPVTEEEYATICQQIKEEQQKAQEFSEKNKIKTQKEKASLPFWSTVWLSFKNLLSKRNRTIITSIACSIGIIGIAVILAVSSGMQGYINTMQSDSASINYLQVSEQFYDFNGLINGDYTSLTDKNNLTPYPEDINGVIPYDNSQVNPSYVIQQTLTTEYIDYVKNIDQDWLMGMHLKKGVALNIAYKTDMDTFGLIGTNYLNEIISNSQYVAKDYEIMATADPDKVFPTQANELALVVDKYNRVPVDFLNKIGLAITPDQELIDYSVFLNKEFHILTNDQLYHKESVDPCYYKLNNVDDALYQSGMTVKIISVIRQKESALNTWLPTGLAYTTALTDYVLQNNLNSQICIDQRAINTYNVLSPTHTPFFIPTEWNTVLKTLGAIDTPTSIIIYPKDFESKNKIVEYLDYWNSTEVFNVFGYEKDADGNYIAEQYMVRYTDMMQVFGSMLQKMVDIITYVLIAFSLVSLVVSSIMIAIITYASVIERIKEIGVLRSMGARKKDVSLLFIAEASIIGLLSALIALVVTGLITIIINAILAGLVEVSTIASLKITTAISMIGLCVGLNLIASLIPANIASKKDPVVALRSE